MKFQIGEIEIIVNVENIQTDKPAIQLQFPIAGWTVLIDAVIQKGDAPKSTISVEIGKP